MAKKRVAAAVAEASQSDVRGVVLAAGAKNLREFGYPNVTADNIMSTLVFRMFFDKMLEDTLADPRRFRLRADALPEVRKLRAEIAYLNKPGK